MIRPLLVFYDVHDDADRDDLRGALRVGGYRLQQSVWAIPPTRTRPDRVVTVLGDLLADDDRLLVIAPCDRCLADVLVHPAGADLGLQRRTSLIAH